jgi:hypothetical protein
MPSPTMTLWGSWVHPCPLRKVWGYKTSWIVTIDSVHGRWVNLRGRALSIILPRGWRLVLTWEHYEKWLRHWSSVLAVKARRLLFVFRTFCYGIWETPVSRPTISPKKRQGLLWLSDYTTFPKSSVSPVESIHTKKESAASMLARLSWNSPSTWATRNTFCDESWCIVAVFDIYAQSIWENATDSFGSWHQSNTHLLQISYLNVLLSSPHLIRQTFGQRRPDILPVRCSSSHPAPTVRMDRRKDWLAHFHRLRCQPSLIRAWSRILDSGLRRPEGDTL